MGNLRQKYTDEEWDNLVKESEARREKDIIKRGMELLNDPDLLKNKNEQDKTISPTKDR